MTKPWTPRAEDYLSAAAPAALALEPAPGRSKRYSFVSTKDVISQLADLGYGVVAATQPGKDRPGKEGRAKVAPEHRRHVVVLQHKDDPIEQYEGGSDVGRTGNKLVAYGDAVPRLALRNSHDGRGALWLQSAFYRFVCSNQAIVSARSIYSVSIRHTDLSMDVVREAVAYLAAQNDQLRRLYDTMTRRELTRDQTEEFAAAARRIRWADEAEGPTAGQLLEARRAEDDGRTIWKVYNRVQENLIRGGGEYTKTIRDGRQINLKARPIKGAMSDLRVNGELWDLVEPLAA